MTMRLFRAAGWLTLGLLLTPGCALMRRGPVTPEGFPPASMAARLVDPAQMTQAYGELFPSQPKLELNGAAVQAEGRLGLGGATLTFNYCAVDPQTVRLRAFKPAISAPFIDLIEAEGRMTAILPNAQAAFWGIVRPEGSPFRDAFGVEPGDLMQIFYIGQRIAVGGFTLDERWRTIELNPMAGEGADALTEVRLDRRTGLPSTARWDRSGRHWTVEYRNWDQFTDDQGHGPFLMPRELAVTSSDPHVRLIFRLEGEAGYRFGAQVPPRMFTVPSLSRYTVRPLDELNEVLND